MLPPSVMHLPALGRAGYVVLRLMAQDDDRQVAEAVEFRQKLEAMVAAAEDTKKKAVALLWLLRSWNRSSASQLPLTRWPRLLSG
jgi:hypothetical protein